MIVHNINRGTHSEHSQRRTTHDQILDVAARALRREGYSGVRVAKMMKEAG
jgi:AcrR family transcriptional regulator